MDEDVLSNKPFNRSRVSESIFNTIYAILHRYDEYSDHSHIVFAFFCFNQSENEQ